MSLAMLPVARFAPRTRTGFDVPTMYGSLPITSTTGTGICDALVPLLTESNPVARALGTETSFEASVALHKKITNTVAADASSMRIINDFCATSNGKQR